MKKDFPNSRRNQILMSAVQEESVKRVPSFRAGAVLVGLLAVAAGAGWGFEQLHVPVAWLLGPMAVGVLAAALAGARPLPKQFAGAGQATIGVSALTAMLGSTPGGMEVMVVTAARLGGDPGLVLAMQMARWLMVVLAGPWVALRLSARPQLDGRDIIRTD